MLITNDDVLIVNQRIFLEIIPNLENSISRTINTDNLLNTIVNDKLKVEKMVNIDE